MDPSLRAALPSENAKGKQRLYEESDSENKGESIVLRQQEEEEEEEEAGCYMSPNQANHMPDHRLCALTG